MAMFGMNVSSGGDFLPIVKYDARAGRMFRVDRDPISGEKTQVDITGPDLRFAIDFGGLQVGYVQFTANGPVRAMVPYGKPLPVQPQDKDEAGKLVSKPGFYVLIAGKGVGGIREWCSNAAILLGALDELYQVYEQSPEARQGKIPLISVPRTIPVKSGRGAQSSTNYKPEFAIDGWVDRLADMGERTVPVPASRMPPQHPHQHPPASAPTDTLAADAEALAAMTGAKAAAMAGGEMPF